MKRIPRTRTRVRAAARGAFSHALVLFTLFAFAVSSYVTQTHIHYHPVGAPVTVDQFDGVPATGKDKAPAKDDESNCPLCQAFASTGQFVTPAAAAILLPSFHVSIIEIVPLATKLVHTVSHTWRGRGPPLG